MASRSEETSPDSAAARDPEPDGAAGAGTVRACLFAVAGRRFAIEVSCARELVVIEACTRVPLAPSHLVGVTNHMGRVLPLVDIRPLLGLPPHGIDRRSRALVIESASVAMAIAVDEVLGLSALDTGSSPDETAPGQEGELGASLVPHGDTKVALLDAGRLIGALRSRTSWEKGEVR